MDDTLAACTQEAITRRASARLTLLAASSGFGGLLSRSVDALSYRDVEEFLVERGLDISRPATFVPLDKQNPPSGDAKR